jgi:hypothetical protein
MDVYGHLFPAEDEVIAERLHERRIRLSSLGTRTTGWLRYLHDTSCGVRKQR